MKSELEKACNAFVQENDQVRFLIIHQGKQMRMFPASFMDREKQKTLKPVIDDLSRDCSEFSHLILSGDKMLFTSFKHDYTVIIVCDSDASVSRVRMELNIFMEKYCQQSGYLQRITSMFNS